MATAEEIAEQTRRVQQAQDDARRSEKQTARLTGRGLA